MNDSLSNAIDLMLSNASLLVELYSPTAPSPSTIFVKSELNCESNDGSYSSQHFPTNISISAMEK